MRLRAAMLGLLCCAVGQLRAAEFPYTARMGADGVVFRSGPGEEYYGCGKLDRGTAVEIYREQAGWLAIRPPEGSFSWVAAKDLKLLDGGLAEVVRDGAFAAVGSSLEAARDVQQVRLEEGEVVELLDTGIEEGRGAPKFHRIAPPSGEFRWIAARDIDAGVEGASHWKRATGRIAAPRRQTAGQDAADDARDEATSTRAAESREDWIAADDREESAAERFADDDSSVGSADSEVSDEEIRAVAAARPRGESAEDDALWDDLDAIDLELSRIVVQEPSAWRLADLRDGAELVLERASGADVRSRARRLVKRIRRFDDIRQRALELADGATPGLQRVAIRDEMPLDDRRTQPESSQGQSSPPESPQAAPAEADVAAAGATPPPEDLARKYDGVGTLTRVEAQSVGGPLFALVDDAGAVRKYVSAAPGVNLRPFVGREVGIVGLRGYLPDLKADHVTAKRIEPLAAATLR